MSKSWNLRSLQKSTIDRFPAAQPIHDAEDLPECVGCVDRDNQIYNLNQLIINLNTQNQNLSDQIRNFNNNFQDFRREMERKLINLERTYNLIIRDLQFYLTISIILSILVTGLNVLLQMNQKKTL